MQIIKSSYVLGQKNQESKGSKLSNHFSNGLSSGYD